VAEGRTQRARNVEVAAAGFGVDVRGTAPAVTTVYAKRDSSYPDVAADPIEFFPRPCAIDVEIRAKTQRIYFDTCVYRKPNPS
jgi:hypothetical protein